MLVAWRGEVKNNESGQLMGIHRDNGEGGYKAISIHVQGL